MQALRKVNFNEIPKIIPKIPVSSVKNRREVFHDKVTCLLRLQNLYCTRLALVSENLILCLIS